MFLFCWFKDPPHPVKTEPDDFEWDPNIHVPSSEEAPVKKEKNISVPRVTLQKYP